MPPFLERRHEHHRQDKKICDFTFYYSANDKVTSINSTTFLTDKYKNSGTTIETFSGPITRKRYNDAEAPKQSDIMGRVVINLTSYDIADSNNDGIIDINGIQTFIFPNGDSVDTISIVFYRQNTRGKDGNVIQPYNTSDKFQITSGTGKYIDIKGTVEVKTNKTLERTVNIKFDK